jgi:hypothetical protein
VYNAQGSTSNNRLYVRYVHLTKAKPINKRQTRSSCQRECYIRTKTSRVQLKKEISGYERQGPWRKEELGGKQPVLK